MEKMPAADALDRALRTNDVRLARRALLAGVDPNVEMVWQSEASSPPDQRLCFTPLEWCVRMSLVNGFNSFRRARWHVLIARLLAGGADPTHPTKGLGEGGQSDVISLALLFRSQPLLDLLSKFHVRLPEDRLAFYLDKARADQPPWPEGEAWIRRHAAMNQCDHLERATPRASGRRAVSPRL